MPWEKANRELTQLLEDSLEGYKAEGKVMFGSVAPGPPERIGDLDILIS